MINVGIIGMGIRGQMYAETVEQSNKATVAAVSDVNEGFLEKTKNHFNANGYTDYKDMFEQENLDAVIVATPDFLHKEPVILAAKKGIHIMVEKPFSTDMEEAEEMAEAIRQNNVRSEEHTSELQSRFDLVCRLLLEKKNNKE